MQSATDKSHDLIGEFGFIEGYGLGGDGEQGMVDSLFLLLPFFVSERVTLSDWPLSCLKHWRIVWFVLHPHDQQYPSYIIALG